MTKKQTQDLTPEQEQVLIAATKLMIEAGIDVETMGTPLTTEQLKLAAFAAAAQEAVDTPWYKRGWIQLVGAGIGGAVVGSAGTLAYQKFFGDNDDSAPIGNSGPGLGMDDMVNNPAGHNQYTPSAQLVH